MPPRTPFTPRIDSPDITALSRAGSPMDVPPNVTAERATVIGIDPSRDAYRVRTITGRGSAGLNLTDCGWWETVLP